MKKAIIILFVTVMMFSLSGCSISALVGKTTSKPTTLTIPKTTIKETTQDGEATTTHIQYKAYKVVKGSNCYEVMVKTYGDEENTNYDWTYFFLSDGTLIGRSSDLTNTEDYPQYGNCHAFYFCSTDLELFINSSDFDHVEGNKYYPDKDSDEYFEIQTDEGRITECSWCGGNGAYTIEYNECGLQKSYTFTLDNFYYHESTTFQEVPIDEN